MEAESVGEVVPVAPQAARSGSIAMERVDRMRIVLLAFQHLHGAATVLLASTQRLRAEFGTISCICVTSARGVSIRAEASVRIGTDPDGVDELDGTD